MSGWLLALALAQLAQRTALLWCTLREAAILARRDGFDPHLPRPDVVIAATGRLPGLERLRDALLAQSVPPHEILFAVEAEADPAHARIAAVFAGSALPWRIVVAGISARGSQKGRNLAAALAILPDARPLVMADADIVPQPLWLATLLRRIANGRADIVTGYRWPVPQDAAFATLLHTWIDRGISALPKPVGRRLIWGGSVALAPGVRSRLDLAAGLEAEISDDLFLARQAQRHGLRVHFAPGALLATDTRHGPRTLAGFGRRQYQMLRLYAAPLWLFAFAATALNLAGATAAVALALKGGLATLPLAAVLLLALATLAAQRRLARLAGLPAGAARAERRLPLLVAVLPLVQLAHLLMILAATRTRTITWRRRRYRMRGRRIMRVERLESDSGEA